MLAAVDGVDGFPLVRTELRFETLEAFEIVERSSVIAHESQDRSQPSWLTNVSVNVSRERSKSKRDVARILSCNGADRFAHQELDRSVRCIRQSRKLFDEPTVACRHWREHC